MAFIFSDYNPKECFASSSVSEMRQMEEIATRRLEAMSNSFQSDFLTYLGRLTMPVVENKNLPPGSYVLDESSNTIYVDDKDKFVESLGENK